MLDAALTASCCLAVMFAINWLIVAAYLVSVITGNFPLKCSLCASSQRCQLLVDCVQVNGTGLSLVYSIKSFAQLVNQYHVFAKCYQC